MEKSSIWFQAITKILSRIYVTWARMRRIIVLRKCPDGSNKQTLEWPMCISVCAYDSESTQGIVYFYPLPKCVTSGTHSFLIGRWFVYNGYMLLGGTEKNDPGIKTSTSDNVHDKFEPHFYVCNRTGLLWKGVDVQLAPVGEGY
jgi:hypothetical protein